MALIDFPTLPSSHPRARQHNVKLNRHWLRAVRFMAWLNLSIEQAAEKAGVSAEGLRVAMTIGAVKAAYIQACEEFRTGCIAAAIHRLRLIALESDNHMASLHAIRQLMQPIVGHELAKQTNPGVVIQVLDGQDKTRAE